MQDERTRKFRIAKYRVALVREGSIATTWDRTVRQASDVAALMAPMANETDREGFWVILLDGRNKVIGINLIALGSLTSALIHPRETYKSAILANAAALILCHNHPSGDPSPSQEDVSLSRRLYEVGELLGIRVLDHIVIGENGAFRSLAEEGQLGGVR